MRITIRVSAITIALIILLFSSLTAFAATTPTITVGSASGKPGETVAIPLSISNNSGIIALYCSVDYDATQIKLTKVTNGSVLSEPAHSGTLTTNPYRLCFDMSLATANNKNNGVIATLEFEILPAAKSGNTEISVSYDPEEIYDYNLKNVHFETIGGKVSISLGNSDATQPESTTNESSKESDKKPESTTGVSSSESTNKIENDVEPKTSSSDQNNKIDVTIEPREKTPWDKVIIAGTNIKHKNVITEQTDEGLVIRGDDFSGVSVEIQKEGKIASVDIDTDQKVVLLKENEYGYAEGYIDANDDGIFEMPLIEPIPFDDMTDNSLPTTLKILIPIIIVVVIIGFVLVIVRKRNIEIKKKNKSDNS